MGINSVQERMKNLHDQITHHAKLYYQDDAPVIADSEYNDMEREFRDLCDQHPELAVQFEFHDKPVPIHEPTGVGLKPITLAVAMLSAKKANDVQEVHRFCGSFKNTTTFIYEAKLDGLALEIKYLPYGSDFRLEHIVTRGAGLVGEDVTHAHPLFSDLFGIPSTIKWDVEEYGPAPEELLVRGEGYVTIGNFNRLNETYDKKKATPRNAVAGWIRALPENQDQQILGQLNFASYWCNTRMGCYRYQDLREKLLYMGFHSPLLFGFEDIVENRRGTMHPVDGIMIKVNEFDEWDRVGETAKWPNYMLAYKFPNEEVQSPIESVEWNTSRFGRVVPVGKYAPVRLGGVMCKSALLDNYGNFMELGLCVGDLVSVTRNNDVVPRINHVTEHRDGPVLEAPTECPSCSALLEVVVGPTSSDLVCNNVARCPAQLTRRCVNMVDKFALNIDGLGPVILGELVDLDHVKVPADIFRLKASAKSRMPEYVWDNIQNARRQPLFRVVKALGLPEVGIVLAKRIANALPTWAKLEEGGELNDALEKALTDPRFLTSIRGISSGTAMKIVNAFNDAHFEENFRDLMDMLDISYELVREDQLRVCVTGSLTGSRDEMISYFANHEIELTDKLTQDCKVLIIGQRPSKSKLLKATEWGMTMLNMQDYSSVDNLIEAIRKPS